VDWDGIVAPGRKGRRKGGKEVVTFLVDETEGEWL